jgi:hypothetical protein
MTDARQTVPPKFPRNDAKGHGVPNRSLGNGIGPSKVAAVTRYFGRGGQKSGA